MLSSQVERLERDIDTLNDEAGAADLLRAARRHAGGRIPACRPHHLPSGGTADGGTRSQPDEPVNAAAIHYINRLSDFLFVAAARPIITAPGDVLWVPGQNR